MRSVLRLAIRAAAAAIALALLALVWAAVVLATSRGDLLTARKELQQAQAATSPRQTASLLASATARLKRADGRLRAPGPAVARHVPVAGATVEAVAVTVRATLVVAQQLQRVVTDARGQGLVVDGRVDLARLAVIQADLRRAARATTGPVNRLDDAPTSRVPGSVASAVATARTQLSGLPQRLSQAADAVSATADLLGKNGPRHVLVVLENNAELRGTGGLVSVFAQGTTQNGKLELQGFRDVQDVADVPATSSPPRRVPAPADYHQLWGPFLADTTLWKNTNMSPDIPTSSSVLAAVAATTLHQRPDDIIWLDVRTIAAVLDATGPATLPDGSALTGDNAVRLLLSQAYRTTTDDEVGQGLRRARLRGAADVVLHRLLGGSPELVRLAPRLGAATAGRHLAVWSADPTQQQAWTRAGADGGIRAGSGDILSVAVQNFGGGDTNGNKLDYYARRLVTLSAVVSRDEATVEQVVTLRNTAPRRGLPVYVAGKATPGISNNFVTFAAPRAATLLEFSRGGASVHTEVASEGDHRVLTDLVSLPPGTSVSWRLRYRLPVRAGSYQLTVVPQPLAVDAGISVRVMPAPGLNIRGSDLTMSGPFTQTARVEATVTNGNLPRRILDRLRRFWSEPVRLPG